ncbi:MAG: DUF2062 domain-containing protein [Hyphomicrobiales bacterium]|nr:DUF2062 domain-containing protein [Hyphomicrobiales bacterium]
MLFRRRVDPHFLEKLRVWAWPRTSWRRSAKYFSKRVLRLTASPHAVAAGFAAGVFASFTPFLGFHILIASVTAFLIGGNLVAAVLGTAVGNPLTFPVMFAATYEVGSLILGTEPQPDQAEFVPGSLTDSFEAIVPVIKPKTVGAVPLGVGAGIVAYFIVRTAVRGFQHGRRQKFDERARLRRMEAEQPAEEGDLLGGGDEPQDMDRL